MNNKNIEVELKFIVDDEKFLLDWLKLNAKLIYKDRQIDKYFTPIHRDFLSIEQPIEFLRVRNSQGKWSITYKYFHSNNEQYSYCDEFESELSDGENLLKIFKMLDLKHLVTVNKIRSSYAYKGFEIELDNVKDIGLICEIEIKEKFNSPDQALQKIKDLAKDLKLEEGTEDIQKGRYMIMLAKKKGLIK